MEIYSYSFLEKFRENKAFTNHSVEMYYKMLNKFREINSLVTYLIKMLLSRIYVQKV